VPLVHDLADALCPLLASGLRAAAATAGTAGSSPLAGQRAAHFELFACDLVVGASGRVALMEVNVNPAFGTFTAATEARLMRPLFEDLLSLCVLPAAGAHPRAGRFRLVRPPGGLDGPSSLPEAATKELQAHQAYVAFKKSSRKRYEHQFADRPLVLSSAPAPL